MSRPFAAALAALTLSLPVAALAQGTTSSDPAAQPAQPAPPLRITVPTLTVTAQKEPADPQTLPVSVTTVSDETLRSARITEVSEAAIFAPNTYFSELSARKISNARFRGIGASPANPSITTYIDGVPQLNANSSSIQFLAVDQVEFVRGPQSALFGRNTLGGLVNIASGRPSLERWQGSVTAPFGSDAIREVRGDASGPLTGTLSAGFALGYAARDGFTTNDLTGNDIDSRSATSLKGQLRWTPSSQWETRLIVSGERARDGDYALNDLAAVRANPFHVARDFEGTTERDVFNTTILSRYERAAFSVTSTTGFVSWETRDLTDLDYSPLPIATRDNREEDFQFTQEVRFASPANAPMTVGAASLRWQGGVFLFTQRFDQDAVNVLSPFVLSPQVPFAVRQHSPDASLDDWGLGLYGQGVFTVAERIDLTAGARFDYEDKDAMLRTFLEPAIFPPSVVDASRSFSNVSPQFGVTYRFQPNRMAYASIARGFKAGGFNPAAPPGSEAYDEEYTWHVEGGTKTTWAEGRVSANVAAFYIDWNDLQLNVPNPFVPAQFYIDNVGGGSSTGLEVELAATPYAGVDVFGSVGFTRARFGDGSAANGLDVSDNDVPNTPDYQVMFGAHASRPLRGSLALYGRADVVFYGAFKYDEANLEGQDAYSLANFRGGVRTGLVFAEAWIRNAFDTRYIPVAFAYPGFAPSGFVGEPGRPRTFGVAVGVTF